ncbi:MAG: methyltransferase domain-containing protein [Candidatus Micrarchaeia archaeon]
MPRAPEIRVRLNPLLDRLRRGPQVMLPKDIGLILAYTGVGREGTAVDAGTGSGFLAISLANVCSRVVTYEWREEFVRLARQNIEKSGLANIELKHASVFDGIAEREVDLVTLDLANPEKALPHAAGALKRGGFVVAYLPHAEQVSAFVKAARESGAFDEPFTLECIEREYLVREAGFRPENKGITHTGYLSFARKK